MQSARPPLLPKPERDVKSDVAIAPRQDGAGGGAKAIGEYRTPSIPPLRPRRELSALPFVSEPLEGKPSDLVSIHYMACGESDLKVDDELGFSLRFSDKFAGSDGLPMLVPVRIVNVDNETEQQVYDAYTLLARLESDAQSPVTKKIIKELVVDEKLERERCAHFKERAAHLKALIDACGGVGFKDAEKLTYLIDGISKSERENLSQKLKDKRVGIKGYGYPLDNIEEIHRDLASVRNEPADALPPEREVRVDIRGPDENLLPDRELDEIEVRYESRRLFYLKKALSLRPVVFVYSAVGIESYHMMMDLLLSARAAKDQANKISPYLQHEPAADYFGLPMAGGGMSAVVGALAYIFDNINLRRCFNDIATLLRNKGIVAEVLASGMTNGFFQIALENHLFWLQEREKADDWHSHWQQPTFAEKSVGSPRLISMGVVAGVSLVRAGLFYCFKRQAQAQRNNDDRHAQPAAEARGNRNG